MARASRKTRERIKQLGFNFENAKNDVRKDFDEPWKRERDRLLKQIVVQFQTIGELQRELSEYRTAN